MVFCDGDIFDVPADSEVVNTMRSIVRSSTIRIKGKDEQFPLDNYRARADDAIDCVFHNDNAVVPSLPMIFVPVKSIKIFGFRDIAGEGESLEALKETSPVVVASEGPDGVPCGVVRLDFRRDEGGVEDEV